MKRLTERYKNGTVYNVSETKERAVDRLAAYEETGLEPEDILRILDAYGRGMTLRTESAQRLEIVKDIQTDRLRELAEADREGRLEIIEPDVAECVKIVKKAQAALRREQDGNRI